MQVETAATENVENKLESSPRTIFPAYLNSNKTQAQGRRVPVGIVILHCLLVY